MEELAHSIWRVDKPLQKRDRANRYLLRGKPHGILPRAPERYANNDLSRELRVLQKSEPVSLEVYLIHLRSALEGPRVEIDN